MTQIWRAFDGLVPVLAALAVAAGALFVVMTRLAGRRRRVVAWAAAAVWLLAVALVTLSPRPRVIAVDGGEHAVQLVPLHVAYELVLDPSAVASSTLAEVAANLALFVPLGVIAPFLWPNRASLWRRVALSAIAMSLAIETCQWATELGRQASIDDVILAVLGALLGYLGVRLATGATRQRRTDHQDVRMEPSQADRGR